MVTPEPVIGPRPSWHSGKGSPPGGRVHLSCRPASAGPAEPAELRAPGGPSAVGRQGSWAHAHVESQNPAWSKKSKETKQDTSAQSFCHSCLV